MQTLINPETKNTDTNDNEPLAHYAEKAKVTEGYIMGTPVIALCGKVFVPHRDPEKLRVCSRCQEIYDGLFNVSD